MQSTAKSHASRPIVAVMLIVCLAGIAGPVFAAGPRWAGNGENPERARGPAAGAGTARAVRRATSVQGEGGTRTLLYVPFISQVYDVDPSFNGSCACGVASTAMVLAYYGRIAPRAMALGTPYLHTSQYGWALTDSSYSYGNTTFSREVAGCDGSGDAFGGLYGALMVDDNHTLTEWQRLIAALAAHGLAVSTYDSINYDMLKAAIDAGHPVIVGSLGLTGSGHLVVVTGYTSDGRIIVNDPYGSKWAGYPNYDGAFVTLSMEDFGTIRQAWEIAGDGTGWQGVYFDAQGTPYVRYDRDLNFDWGNQGPQGAPVNAQSFSARWTQAATADAGAYQVHATTDGDLRVRVDGQVVLEHVDDGTPGVQQQSAAAELGAGAHQIEVEYRHNVGDPAVVQVRLIPPAPFS